MKIKSLIQKYNLIGSLLESICVDTKNKTVTLELDFCYWQQKNFTDGNKETGMVALIFSEYTECDISEHKINSDEIVKVEAVDDNTIDICVESDLTGEYHHIRMSALDVEFVEL